MNNLGLKGSVRTIPTYFQVKNYRVSVPSVSIPFMGDYINLRRNPVWRDSLRRNGLKRLDRHVVFADFANKINRSNGKVGKIFMVWVLCDILLITNN